MDKTTLIEIIKHPNTTTLLRSYFQQASDRESDVLSLLHSSDSILRRDLPSIFQVALQRPLEVMEIVAIQKCFNLDTQAVMTWAEFSSSLSLLTELLTNPSAAAPKLFKSSSNASYFATSSIRKSSMKGHKFMNNSIQKQQQTAVFPQTTNQEIGWCIASSFSSNNNGTTTSRGNRSERKKHFPIKESDITKGGEGRSLATFYGPFLA